MSDVNISVFVEKQIEAVRRALGGEKALIAISGGVDSTVSAVITHCAIGDNLVCVFIDDNFMRLEEPKRVRAMLSAPPLNLPVKILDERKRFMEALRGLSDAEEKRKAFRDVFYRTLSESASRERCRFLVQGTIKADVVETEGGIKTQHNVLEQIGIDSVERFGFKVIEPVVALYKHQVREAARYLGAPHEISDRQPFPGPGLSVRAVGEITDENLEELKKATAIVEEGFKAHAPDQYFAAIFSGGTFEAPKAFKDEIAESLNLDASHVEAVFLSEMSTGIVDGKRAYGSVAAMRVSDSSGRPLHLGYDALEAMRTQVQNRHPEVTRVLYLVEGEEMEGYVVALRAVRTRDFITAALAEIPWSTLTDVSTRILRTCPKVSRVYFDVTPKPPATIEFE